ncbi:D-hexose-6-phosphate mutarotase [Enemella dayhoffiae]|uniref:Putative glucose-6-phosphate 1-epimerase n=1 Tax=Enemella dayhoffiae TaxID=2016507 RepID=A0A255GYE0_9ACTN|nr:D-hexose-6-phosphate mutarotase [Enemella dayhoffiae]OYO18644.1 D-hexose-6-phosphate mutarotase [Enemella dayhoffiae]
MFERHEATDRAFGRCTGDVPNGTPHPGRFQAVDHGAQILSWAPTADTTDVFFVSERAHHHPLKAIRGGVPVCFPWFGPGRSGRKRPSHGFARIANWQLERAREVAAVTTLDWRFDETMIPEVDHVDRHRNRFQAHFQQVFGPELELRFSVRNTDPRGPMVFELALHAYFRVGDVRQLSVDGLSGVDYLDKVGGDQHTQIGPVRLTGEVDRVYAGGNRLSIDDPVLGRRTTVHTHNSANTVVWNPGAEKSASLDDLAPGEWQRFVCVEPGNVQASAVHLHPGESHEMSVRIAVEELP